MVDNGRETDNKHAQMRKHPKNQISLLTLNTTWRLTDVSSYTVGSFQRLFIHPFVAPPSQPAFVHISPEPAIRSMGPDNSLGGYP